MSDWKTDLAAYSITHQTRHLFGPDAIITSGTLSGSLNGAGVGGAVGHIHILYGKNGGLSQAIFVGSAGGMWPGASATGDITKVYYSGNMKQFNEAGFNAFYGSGQELTIGGGAYGISASVNFSYAPSTPPGAFTLGFGFSLGLGTPQPGGSAMATETIKR